MRRVGIVVVEHLMYRLIFHLLQIAERAAYWDSKGKNKYLVFVAIPMYCLIFHLLQIADHAACWDSEGDLRAFRP
jgi:hypothetical protein